MKFKWAVLIMGLALARPEAAHAQTRSVFDLIGDWEATVELGKLKIRLIVRVTKTPAGTVMGKIEVPDQGARDIPVSAMLCNYPAVRWEIDPFDNTTFNGTVNEDRSQIAGQFDAGPGGRPLPVVFKRRTEPFLDESKLAYSFKAGEARDLRGYWQARIPGPDAGSSRLGLRIGRTPSGQFHVLLDVLDRGMTDLAAATVQTTNSEIRLEWTAMQLGFEGKLEDGKITGIWKERGKSTATAFERLDRPATVLPPDASFVPDKDAPLDLRGEWKGALEIPGNRLRLVLRIGKTPEGAWVGTLASPDQGGGQVPMTSASVTNAAVKLEWKAIRGVYKGTLNKDGTLLDGTWEQMGPPLKLKLERAVEAKASDS